MGLIETIQRFFGFGKVNRQALSNSGTIEKAFGVYSVASREMDDNINLWYAMYINHPPWETHEVRPLGLPAAIGRELSRHALTEFAMTVSGGARADYINQQFEAMIPKLSNYLEMGLCLGGVALKPYPIDDRVLVDAFTTDFTPTRFSDDGKAIGGVFKSKPLRSGKDWYVKMEYHDFTTREDGSSVYVVENKAYRSNKDGGIGAQIRLTDVPEWADLSEREEIDGLDGPLFAYFKPPAGNSIDVTSPMGISVYAGPTVDLIKQADQQWEKLRWTFQVAEPKIITDGNIDDVKKVNDRIFLPGAFTSSGNLFQIFDPAVKDSEYYRGLQYILQRIEFNVGLAFGSISDPQSVEKTATEILATKQRQFVTEGAIQKALQSSLDDLVYAMDAWCSLLGLAPAGTYKTEYNWGDGVLDDPDTRRQDMAMDLQLLSAGILNDWEFRSRWMNEDEETARKMLPKMEEMTDEEQDEVE